MGNKYIFIIILIVISLHKGAVFSENNRNNKENTGNVNSIIIDHTYTKISNIPVKWIKAAKKNLHIAYGHTSHGQQLIEGMKNLDTFMAKKGSDRGTYAISISGSTDPDVLDIRDNVAFKQKAGWPFPTAKDLGTNWNGKEDYSAWVADTRDYLKDRPEVNVIIWSWCGQVSYCPDKVITDYLDNMNKLEKEFPNVKFIYMTGHLDGTGLKGKLHLKNNIIREFCKKNKKILYDFEDIESYDPDGKYYGDKYLTDGSNYDYNSNGKIDQTKEEALGWMPATPLNGDRNWALDWQKSHNEGTDWYECRIKFFHAHNINVNLKAYAAWSLLARLAGWEGK